MNKPSINRRQALGAAATAAIAAPAIATAQGAAKRPMLFKDPAWNRDMKARLESFLDPKKFIYGAVTGTVAGVRDGERVRPLMRFEVFSTIRILPQADGSFHRLCREVVFYRNLATGELMDQWDNPYTGEPDYRDLLDMNAPLSHAVHWALMLLGGLDDGRFRRLELAALLVTAALSGALLPRRLPSWSTRLVAALCAAAAVVAEYLRSAPWHLSQRDAMALWFVLPALAVGAHALRGPAVRSLRPLAIAGALVGLAASLCGFSLLALAAALLSVRAIVGDIRSYLFAWATVATVPGLAGIAHLALRAAPRRPARALVYGAAGLLCLGALPGPATTVQGVPIFDPALARSAAAAADAVGPPRGQTVHVSQAEHDQWPDMAAVVDQLYRRGHRVAVRPGWTFMFGDTLGRPTTPPGAIVQLLSGALPHAGRGAADDCQARAPAGWTSVAVDGPRAAICVATP